MFGRDITEERAETDPTNDVVSPKYENQFETDEDIERIKVPVVTHDPAETERRLAVVHELLDGILDVRPWGADPYLPLWDPISMWMGAEAALFALIDRPEYVHRLVGRMTDGYLFMLDQLEWQRLLSGPQSLVHCTGAYTDELPARGYDAERPRTKGMWTFRLVCYGCCDPLDSKMDQVRMIPNVRKVSMSPWTNHEAGAEEVHDEYVFSRKPNPAFVATDLFDEELDRSDLQKTKEICDRTGCHVEFIMKDISTERYHPERLTRSADIAMEVAGA